MEAMRTIPISVNSTATLAAALRDESVDPYSLKPEPPSVQLSLVCKGGAIEQRSEVF